MVRQGKNMNASGEQTRSVAPCLVDKRFVLTAADDPVVAREPQVEIWIGGFPYERQVGWQLARQRRARNGVGGNDPVARRRHNADQFISRREDDVFRLNVRPLLG